MSDFTMNGGQLSRQNATETNTTAITSQNKQVLISFVSFLIKVLVLSEKF